MSRYNNNPYGGSGGNPYAQQDNSSSNNSYGGSGGRSQGGLPSGPRGGGGGGGAGLPSGPRGGGGAAGGLPSGPRGGNGAGRNGGVQGDGYGGRNGAAVGEGYGGAGQQYGGAGQGGGYGRDVEMQPVAAAGNFDRDDPNAILNECQKVSREIQQAEGGLTDLRTAHTRYLNDMNPNNREIERLHSQIMDNYRALTDRVRVLKGRRDAGSPRNAPQIGKVDRDLKRAINDFQRIESDFRRQVTDKTAREYRIVNPAATEEEIREAAEDPNTQVFQQALMQGNRSAQARSALNAVQRRHEEIQNIERTLIELAEMFQDLERIVVEQEPLVAKIEQQAEQVQDDLVKGNTEMTAAVSSARAARKKKWICLGICVAIIAVIIIIVLVYMAVTGKFNSSSNTTNNTTKTT